MASLHQHAAVIFFSHLDGLFAGSEELVHWGHFWKESKHKRGEDTAVGDQCENIVCLRVFSCYELAIVKVDAERQEKWQ